MTLRDQFDIKISAVEIEYAKLEDTNLSLNEQIKYLQNNLGHIQQGNSSFSDITFEK